MLIFLHPFENFDHETNAETRVECEALTLSLYGDFLPVLRSQREDIFKEGNDETGIQRYRAALGKTQRLLEEIKLASLRTHQLKN